MRKTFGESRGLWLVVGLLAGLSISSFWPSEPVQADMSDRSEKFGMMSTHASAAGGDCIFVLDFLTGQLQGFYLNPRAGAFTQMFYRNVANDFTVAKVKGGVQPMYSFVGGIGQLTGRGMTFGGSVVYVAELTTGTIAAYGFPFTEQNRPIPPQEMVVIDTAQFRQKLTQ